MKLLSVLDDLYRFTLASIAFVVVRGLEVPGKIVARLRKKKKR